MNTVPGSIVVAFKDRTTKEQAEAIIATVPGANLYNFFAAIKVGFVRVEPGKEKEAIKTLKNSKVVNNAHENYACRVPSRPHSLVSILKKEFR